MPIDDTKRVNTSAERWNMLKALNKLGIKGKFLLAVSAANLCLLVICAIFIFNYRNSIESYKYVANVNLVKTRSLAYMSGASRDITRLVIKLALPDTSEKEIKRLLGRIDETVAIFDGAYKELSELPREGIEIEEFKELDASWKTFSTVVTGISDNSRKSDDAGRTTALEMIRIDFKKASDDFFSRIESFIANQNADAKERVAKAQVATTKAEVISLAILGSAVLFNFIFGFLFAKHLHLKLSHLATRLNSGATDLQNLSTDVAHASETISGKAQEQSSALDESAASLTQLNAMVHQNAQNAQSSGNLSTTSLREVRTGQDKVRNVVSAIGNIENCNKVLIQRIEHGNQKVLKIRDAINEIGTKTQVINEIVFQTRLLSFNASIEAARAGTAGAGFSVVAEEVGKLAQMSGAAASEISSILSSAIERVDSAVREIQENTKISYDESTQSVKVGKVASEECEEVINGILRNVEKMHSMTLDISTASREQSVGLTEINRAVDSLNATTHSNVATSIQAESTAKSLSEQASQMQQNVVNLQELIFGGSYGTKAGLKRGSGGGEAA